MSDPVLKAVLEELDAIIQTGPDQDGYYSLSDDLLNRITDVAVRLADPYELLRLLDILGNGLAPAEEKKTC